MGDRGALVVGAEGRSREDDPRAVLQKLGFQRGVARHDLGVNAQLPDPAADELGVLAAIIQNQDLIHGLSFTMVCWRSEPTDMIETGVSVNSSMNWTYSRARRGRSSQVLQPS